MGVAGAERPCLGLHALSRGAPAAVEFGQDMDGVVAGVEEDAPPQVGDPVGTALGDPDHAAAGADAPEFLRAHHVPGAGRQRGQQGEGEQGLQGAGRGQPAVRVVGGEHVAGAGVGHQPGQRGGLREAGRPGARTDLSARTVQQRSVRGRPRTGRAGLRPGGTGRRGGHQGQQPRRTERTGRRGHPGRESVDHMINVETDVLRAATTGPDTAREHPDAARTAPNSTGHGDGIPPGGAILVDIRCV